jgi:hypothetical protein
MGVVSSSTIWPLTTTTDQSKTIPFVRSGYFFNRDKVNLDIIWLKDDSLAGGMRGRLE